MYKSPPFQATRHISSYVAFKILRYVSGSSLVSKQKYEIVESLKTQLLWAWKLFSISNCHVSRKHS